MPNKSVVDQGYDEHIWVKHGICLMNPKCSKHSTNQDSDENLVLWAHGPINIPEQSPTFLLLFLIKQEFLRI